MQAQCTRPWLTHAACTAWRAARAPARTAAAAAARRPPRPGRRPARPPAAPARRPARAPPARAAAPAAARPRCRTASPPCRARRRRPRWLAPWRRTRYRRGAARLAAATARRARVRGAAGLSCSPEASTCWKSDARLEARSGFGSLAEKYGLSRGHAQSTLRTVKSTALDSKTCQAMTRLAQQQKTHGSPAQSTR